MLRRYIRKKKIMAFLASWKGATLTAIIVLSAIFATDYVVAKRKLASSAETTTGQVAQ